MLETTRANGLYGQTSGMVFTFFFIFGTHSIVCGMIVFTWPAGMQTLQRADIAAALIVLQIRSAQPRQLPKLASLLRILYWGTGCHERCKVAEDDTYACMDEMSHGVLFAAN